ncbi:MAG: methyltransferase domain-containing protein [Limimaricola sp.]|uniref:RsmB/NOP family class I SAM-dependent RNA methyltransferase n=1 Tax=Limimaricola sp. TaxID=2211665 RepID=UPI001DD91CE2|nr:transcription antitermination factor NusB [Limimaricola sp.]MBI1416959.1 methyltransferase domain-containing protein [Limimaricola sp.]
MTQPGPEAGLAPRRAALKMLQQITGEGRLFPELVEGGSLADLAPEDRARAQRLVLDTLRGLDRADRMLAPYLKKAPPLYARNALRLGTVELCANGEAAHGVVNAMVGLVGADKRAAGLKGLVNAILRKIAAEGPAGWAQRPVPLLPGWLRQPLVAAWGRKAVAGMEAAHFAGAPLDLTPKGDAANVAQALGGQVLPTGSVRLAQAGQVTALPGYDDGDWWVQDAAAALPARLLDAQPGERVLDMCAAPGGKTLQLAASGAAVTALDISEARMERVRRNLTRTGLAASCVVADALDYAQGGWDAILLDAPCSATGTIRRHPDLPQAKDGAEFAALIDQQTALIDHALTLLRPGGRLAFCTCSLLPDEGEVQAEEALARHPGLVAEPPEGLAGIDAGWITPEGGLRLRPDYWPELGGMDGFYMIRLRKPA